MKKVVANIITKEKSVSNGDTVDNPVVTLSKKNNDHSSLPVSPKTKGAKAKKKITKKQKAGKPSVSKTHKKISSVDKLSNELSAMRLRKCPKTINMRGFDQSVSSNGAVTSEHELRYKVVDYFDYYIQSPETILAPVKNYWFTLDQSLIKATTGIGSMVPALRVGSVNLYCLPRTNVTGDSLSGELFTVLFSVPVSPVSGSSQEILGMNQRTTTIHPDFDVSWHHCGSYKLDSVLKSGLYRPLLHKSSDGSYDICLFQFQLVNPDNNITFKGKEVQFKVVFDIYEPLPLINNLLINVQGSDSFTTVVDPVMASEPVFVDLLSMNTNKF